ncbi:MAG: hypothetical protein IJ418_12960 [Clostridia bacterium]|nr:hypothetical protein [Clostridia bacterium]
MSEILSDPHRSGSLFSLGFFQAEKRSNACRLAGLSPENSKNVFDLSICAGQGMHFCW